MNITPFDIFKVILTDRIHVLLFCYKGINVRIDKIIKIEDDAKFNHWIIASGLVQMPDSTLIYISPPFQSPPTLIFKHALVNNEKKHVKEKQYI